MSKGDFGVAWNIGSESGSEEGFRSKEAADRFIKHICLQIDPTKQYSVFQQFSQSSREGAL